MILCNESGTMHTHAAECRGIASIVECRWRRMSLLRRYSTWAACGRNACMRMQVSHRFSELLLDPKRTNLEDIYVYCIF